MVPPLCVWETGPRGSSLSCKGDTTPRFPPFVQGGHDPAVPPFSKGGLGGIFMLKLPFSRNLKSRARDLRRTMTEAERRFWGRVRRKQLRGLQFYRQKNIGPYIVDFYCPAANLVIEIDESRHYSEEGFLADTERDGYLGGLGLTVLRFTNGEVFEEIEAVLALVCQHLGHTPSVR